jgi:hypothetical protein
MSELEKIRTQIENGQGLTCAQAHILWDALSESAKYAQRALAPYQPTEEYLSGLQNSYAGLSANSQAQWKPSENLLARLWPGERE